MARLLDNGTLELLGRRDYEVKVRGYRVDVRQVEKALAAHLNCSAGATTRSRSAATAWTCARWRKPWRPTCRSPRPP